MDRIRFGGKVNHEHPAFTLSLMDNDKKAIDSTLNSQKSLSIQVPRLRTTQARLVRKDIRDYMKIMKCGEKNFFSLFSLRYVSKILIIWMI
jgi:hypothetical protein